MCAKVGPVPTLDSFPRPHVAVDLVILTVLPDLERPTLGVVVQRRDDGVAVLPGRFVRERTTILDTVGALLQEKLRYSTGSKVHLEMLDLYDQPDRDERGWVMSAGYRMTMRPDQAARLSPDLVELLPLHGSAARGRRLTPEPLAYDHDEMVTTAVRRARRRYERSPDPLRLLKPPYTLTQLRHAHEAVLDEPVKRDTFNRRMQPFLQPAHDRRGNPWTSDTGGRPAQMFEPARLDRDPDAGPFPLPRT